MTDTTVSVTVILRVHMASFGAGYVTLKTDHKLPVGRTYKDMLKGTGA